MAKKKPRRLYKYRPFNAYTLRMLTHSSVYYANPKQFNDPLDCDPEIEATTDTALLLRICQRMLNEHFGEERANQTIHTMKYYSTDVEENETPERQFRFMLRGEIRSLLKDELSSSGVLSLARKWNCPLMWSHYADQHRGVCIEFDLKEHRCENLEPIDYHGSRAISAFNLEDWKLNGDVEKGETIKRQFFYAKAKEWKYEQEWRDIRETSGEHHLPFNVRTVYFGQRCDPAVKMCIVRMCSGDDSDIRFHEVYPEKNGFALDSRPVEVGEIMSQPLGRAPFLDFDPINLPQSVNE